MSDGETDVWLTPHDMDHLQDGQPVFKQGNNSALVLRTRAQGGEKIPKRTTGMIAGRSFSLQIDGDAPDELVAEIESALADVKAEVEE